MKSVIKITAVIAFLLTMSTILAEEKETQPNEQETLQSVYTLLRNQQDSKAEAAAKEAIAHFPKTIEFYISLDQALNGQRKYEEAATVRKDILEVWNENYKEAFLENGSPVRDRSWARFIVYTPTFTVIAADYFIPEKTGDEPPFITNYYKFIVMYGPKPEDARIFKLEHSNLTGDYYVISELTNTGFRQCVPFGGKKPDIYTATEGLLQYLKKETEAKEQ